MRRSILAWTCGVAAILAAALAVGCGRDASGPEQGGNVAAPAAQVAAGAVVRTTLRDVIAVPGEGREETVRSLGTAEAEAEVVGRRAVDVRTGTPLAAQPDAWAARALRTTDDSGHAHALVVASAARGPLERVRYERDGQVVAEVAYRWDARDGGFVLRGRTLSLLRHGRVVLRMVRDASPAEVLPGAAPAADAAAGPAECPPVLGMQVDEARCIKEWAVYIGASAALILAGEVYLVAPSPATTSALVAAASAWEKSLNSLLACQVNGVLAL